MGCVELCLYALISVSATNKHVDVWEYDVNEYQYLGEELGNFAVGVEGEHLFAEVGHTSGLLETRDRGFEYIKIGAKWRWSF